MLCVTIKNTKSIEFNDIFDIVLEEYSENTKDNILEFFQTADLNGDGSLEFDEFTRILRHVHYDFFTENKHRKLKLIFDNFSELDEDSGDNVITPLNFK
jgi:EF hand